jgi:CheY-like chemotaxis protein
MANVVYWVQDLLFVSKIREVARQLGVQATSVRDAGALLDAARQAQLVILDLRSPAALEALDRLAADPATQAVAKVGFVDHERTEVMERARERGCKALAKGRFSTELPLLLAELG